MTYVDTRPAPFDATDSPAVVMETLLSIERDLAIKQNAYERAALDWFDAQREIKRAHAVAFISSTASSVTGQKADADLAALSTPGCEYEALYESLRAVLRVLEQRSMILMSVLRAQSRA